MTNNNPTPQSPVQGLVEALEAIAAESARNVSSVATAQGRFDAIKCFARAALTRYRESPSAGEVIEVSVAVPTPDATAFEAEVGNRGRTARINSIRELMRLINGGAKIDNIRALPSAPTAEGKA